MSLEGPPVPPEKKEKEPITDEQAIEAMKAENFELVREWYAQQEKIAEQDPSINGHMRLTLRMAELQLRAGLTDFAKDTLEAAYEDAYQQGDDETAGRITQQLEGLKRPERS
jgi:hypothetical protein